MKKSYIILFVIVCFISFFFNIFLAVKIKTHRNTIKELKQQVIILQSDVSSLKEKKDKIQQELDFFNAMEPIPKQHDIDLKIQKCMKEKNYTTAGMSQCVYDSIDDWEKEINKYLSLSKKVMTKEQYESLQISQKKWNEYKKAQWDLYNVTYGSKLGTIFININAEDKVSIIEQRANELRGFYEIFTTAGD